MVSLLQAAPWKDFALRCRLVRLLGIFGSPEDFPLLLRLILDRREHYLVRNAALSAGARHGLRLSGDELAQLLEPRTALGCDGHDHEGPCRPGLGLILSAVRLEDTAIDEAVKQALSNNLSPASRACILAASDPIPLPSRLVEWLFELWYQTDRHLLLEFGTWGRNNNLAVALAHWERPESRQLLTEWAREMTDEDLEQCLYRNLSREELARLVSATPELRHRAVEGLLLPLPDLLAWFGEEGLLRRLRIAVRTESVAKSVPYRLVKGHPAFSPAVELLCEWQDARQRLLYPLLCDFTVAPEVRHALLEELFAQDREVAVRWARVAARYPENESLVRFVLERTAHQPVPGDRSLFLTGLRGTDEVSQCFAIEGLLALGEAGVGWCDRLTSLAHTSHPAVRLRAAAGLSRQGLSEWLPLLRQTALEASAPWLRAEALRWLAQVDTEASRPIFRQVLTSHDERGPGQVVPGADEAAWALSRPGSDEDLSALLEASVRGCCSPWLFEELEHHLARREGRPFEDVLPPWSREDVPGFLQNAIAASEGAASATD
ncbi:HEAT repeat domain-containing protein [Pyxidicoccus sp. 3LG]